MPRATVDQLVCSIWVYIFGNFAKAVVLMTFKNIYDKVDTIIVVLKMYSKCQ